MIKTVLIDDNKFALKEMEYLLKDNKYISIVGKFTDPLKAIEEIEKLEPHVVILDIDMPQMKGTDVAISLLDRYSDIDIVFMTAYDQYAVDAFEIYALDYILKPVSQERFDKTMQRIIDRVRNSEPQELNRKLIIKTLGSFQVGWEGKEPIKWRTEKIKELFAFLLHNANKEVSKDIILDTIFDDMDLEKSIHQLHNGIYYIKKTLQEYGVDGKKIDIKGKYMLKISREIEVDSLLFKHSLKQSDDEEALETIENMEALYSGDYFEGMDWIWAEAEREKLFRQYMKLTLALSETYMHQNKFLNAEELLLKAYRENPYVEEVTILLLKLYKTTKRKNLALKHFKDYEKVLKEDLGLSPDEEVRKMINSINSNLCS